MDVLKQFVPKFPRALAERVWLRPCISEAHEELPLRALAYAEDSFSQSLLISLDKHVLSTASDAVAGQGYPVLPIALAEELSHHKMFLYYYLRYLLLPLKRVAQSVLCIACLTDRNSGRD